jgi:hypothetical protein
MRRVVIYDHLSRIAGEDAAQRRVRVPPPAHNPPGTFVRIPACRPDHPHLPLRGVLSRIAGEVILLSIAVLFSPICPAFADNPVAVTIRSGNHPDFGRIVFDAPPGVSYRVVRDGDRVTVRFADDVALTGDPKLPRNIAALHADHAQAVLTVAAGATFHDTRLGDHVVVDVFDAAAASAPPHDQLALASQRRSPASTPAPAAVLALASSSPATPAVASPARTAAATPTTTASASQTTPASASPAANPSATPTMSPPAPKSKLATAATKPHAADPPAHPTAAPMTAAKPAPSPASPAPSPAPPARAVAATQAPVPARALTPPPLPTPAVSASAASSPPSPATTATNSGELAPLVALPATLPPGTAGAAFLLPFPDDVGAAVFRHHGETLVVFDDRRLIDMSALQSNPTFAAARVEQLPAGTLIRITPPAGASVTLSKTPQGWTVATLVAPPLPRPLTPDVNEALLSVAAAEPGRVLAIADSLTGGTLFVGTQRRPGEAMLTLHRTPQFTLLATTQGVVVAPLADTVSLHSIPNGFALTTGPDPLAVSPSDREALGDVAALTRRFVFPAQPTDQLLRQLSAQIAEAGSEPALARGPKRRAAAVSMIGLGMGAEAEALLQLTAADDPRQAASADVIGLTAVAAMLAGRPGEADGIDDPRLAGTDEVVLWRALHAAMQDNSSPYAAIALAGTAPLLLTYPPPIRDRLLPLAVETMVQGGAKAASKTLLARAGELPGLDMARAMLAQATGDNEAALAHYDALTASRDQSLSARAAVRAVDLRLASGKFDARQAAEAFDRLLYAWRGDRRELELREKLAGMRQQLGEWRAALALLRDSEVAFPDDAKDIHARLQATFDALLHDDAADKIPPLEFVALVDENADLVPNTREGEAMQAVLADKLVALDLPKRAGPVLDKLMRAVPAGPARATFGARLATLRLGEADASGALAALAASDAADLPAPLTEQRVLMRADAQARWGDVSGAISTLAGIDTVAAGAARAGILEQAKDWVGADRALTNYVAKTVPESGDLDDAARRSLLRLATAAARAGDDATLAALREHQEPRMGTGPLAEMFRLLTADPVHGTTDLARAGREVGFARALPADLQAMRP